MKIKLLNKETIIPKKAYDGDAGFDVYSPKNIIIFAGDTVQIKLGFAIEIYDDEVCIMSERSGMAIKNGITSIGNIIDSNYRGECSIILFNSSKQDYAIKEGDRIGQMLIIKLGYQDIQIVDKLSESERGEKAHNSSGK